MSNKTHIVIGIICGCIFATYGGLTLGLLGGVMSYVCSKACEKR